MMPLQESKPVGVYDKGLSVVLGDDVEDDARHDEQEACDDEHDRTDERRESCHDAGMHEVDADRDGQNQADDAEEKPEPAEERQRLVFADHPEDGAHDFDAVAHGIKLGNRTFRPVPVLDRHLVESQIIVQAVDRHLGLDLETAGEYRIGFGECERECAIPGHDVGDMGAEQSVDRAADQTIAEVVERALVLLEVCGAEAIPNHHVIAFENLLDHGRSGIGWVGIIAVGHDIDIGIDILEHGTDDIALALTGLLADDCPLLFGYFGSMVRGVVVVDVDSGIWQSTAEIAYDFTDSNFLVIAGEEHCDL